MPKGKFKQYLAVVNFRLKILILFLQLQSCPNTIGFRCDETELFKSFSDGLKLEIVLAKCCRNDANNASVIHLFDALNETIIGHRRCNVFV